LPEKLEDIYAELPSIECKGLCSQACGPIGMTPLEWQRLKAAGGREPGIQPGSLKCNMLDWRGRCAAYEARPLICRLWGITENMRCHYGCQPERYLSADEARDFSARVHAVSPGDVWTVGENELLDVIEQLTGGTK
jgi:hypothetical protein